MRIFVFYISCFLFCFLLCPFLNTRLFLIRVIFEFIAAVTRSTINEILDCLKKSLGVGRCSKTY